ASPVPTFHSLIVLVLDVARTEPSGEKATDRAAVSGRPRSSHASRVDRSHSLAPSQLPAARYRPSGEKATVMTRPSPNRGKVCRTRPARTSQSRTFLSEDAEATRVPSFEIATPFMS